MPGIVLKWKELIVMLFTSVRTGRHNASDIKAVRSHSVTDRDVPQKLPERIGGRRTITEPFWVRTLLIFLILLFLGLFLILPLAAVFAQAFEKGVPQYLAAISTAESLAAIRLTLFITAIVVPLNLIFGVIAAWAITKFRFRAKHVLITLIDLPFAVSPVVAGLIFVLLFGLHGVLGPWLTSHDIKIIFAVPGIVLATMFITVPFVARELIPLIQEQGTEEEEAALVLGAGGWKIFFRVTLPNITWGLVYGVILCSARTIVNSARFRSYQATFGARH